MAYGVRTRAESWPLACIVMVVPTEPHITHYPGYLGAARGNVRTIQEKKL